MPIKPKRKLCKRYLVVPAKPKRKQPKRDYTARLFKRFSEITGIPVRALTPEKKVNFIPAAAHYAPDTHTVYEESFFPGINKRMNKHELRHGIQNLLNPDFSKRPKEIGNPKTWTELAKALKTNTELKRKWIEITNAQPKNLGILDSLNSMGFIKMSMMISPLYYSPMIYSYIYLLPQYLTQIKRNANTKRIIKKYGEDGILLLWAAPPKKLDALQIPNWEKQMIQKGYLKENKGLTKKGLQYFRKHLQTQAIWKRLAKFKEERQKK